MVTAEVFSSITEAIHAEMLLVKHFRRDNNCSSTERQELQGRITSIYLFISLYMHSGALCLQQAAGDT